MSLNSFGASKQTGKRHIAQSKFRKGESLNKGQSGPQYLSKQPVNILPVGSANGKA